MITWSKSFVVAITSREDSMVPRNLAGRMKDVVKKSPDMVVCFLQQLLCLCHPLVQLVHFGDL